MIKSFNRIYKFIIQAVVAGFGLTFTGICLLMVYLFFENVLWYIPFFIFALVVSIIAGSFFNVILSIPFKLPQKFDLLKNRVALGEYKNLQEFQEDIANFILTFFNFVGADVVGGKFHLKTCQPTIKECNVDFSLLNQESFTKNKLRLNEDYKAFYLPIELSGEDLGYFILITRGYTIPVLYAVLQDFENYYLDDQIKHFLK